MKIDRTPGVAVQAGVEEAGRILQRRTLGERHLHHVLVGLARGDHPVVVPHGNAAPLPLLDHVGVGALDELPDECERLPAPVTQLLNPGVDQFGGRFRTGLVLGVGHRGSFLRLSLAGPYQGRLFASPGTTTPWPVPGRRQVVCRRLVPGAANRPAGPHGAPRFGDQGTNMTDTHPFDEALRLDTISADVRRGRTHPEWANMVGPFGGITAAAMLAAVEGHPDRIGEPLALTVNFAAPIAYGDFDIGVRAARTNRTNQHWIVELSQDGVVKTTATAVFAIRRESWTDTEANAASAPPP